MRSPSLLLGAGLLAAGVSVQVLVCAGVAAAESESDGPSISQSDDAAATKPAGPSAEGGTVGDGPGSVGAAPSGVETAAEALESEDLDAGDLGAGDLESEAPEAPAAPEAPEAEELEADAPEALETEVPVAPETAAPQAPQAPAGSDGEPPLARPKAATDALRVEMADPDAAIAVAVADIESAVTEPAPALAESAVAVDPETPILKASRVSPGIETATRFLASAPIAAATVASPPNIIEIISGIFFGVFNFLTSLIVGPAVVPSGSTVTVRNSSLQVTDDLSVPADWYFPDTDTPPTRMILLQHGFFAVGPMYSFVAARLAENTNSIVVTPSLSSNPFAVGGLSINGTAMQQAIAALFTGDRSALTASALAAGYAQRYGLDPATAQLPTQFALAGHSAGGGMVSAVAGYLVDYGAADDLAGVVLFDAVASGTLMSDALDKLDDYQEQTGRYIPVRVIAAPLSLWNFPSNINATLSQARPDRYNGVVLAQGVHNDSVQGGSCLGQLLIYLIAGFPAAPNPPALQQLSDLWLNQWFLGETGIGDGVLLPGSSFPVDTPSGTANATVIGTPQAATRLVPESDAALVA